MKRRKVQGEPENKTPRRQAWPHGESSTKTIVMTHNKSLLQKSHSKRRSLIPPTKPRNSPAMISQGPHYSLTKDTKRTRMHQQKTEFKQTIVVATI